MRRVLGSLAVVLLILSLVLGACSPAAPSAPASDKPATTSSESKPAAKPAEPKPAEKAAESKPAAAAKPIKIGYLTPLTGVYAALGTDMRDGFLLYLEQKGNQLAGRPVQVIVEDSEANPDVGLTKAKKLVESDKVNMLAGIIHSGVAYALLDYVKSQKMPLLINNAGADDLTQRQASPYVFRNSYANSQNIHVLGEWAYKKGYRKAALLAADYSAGYESVGGFARSFTGAGGNIIQELYPALGAPDPSPFITSIKPDADVLYTFGAGADALRFVKTYAQYGMNKKLPVLSQYSLTDDTILKDQGDAAIGIVNVAGWTTDLNTPANKAFMDAYNAKYKRGPTLYAESGYDGAMMLEKALQSVQGNIEDTDPFIKAFEKVEVTDSPRGPIKFDKYHNIVMNVYVTEVKKVDGKLVNAVIDTYKDVSQFGKWGADEYLKMPSYSDMKGKWAK